jgi:SAM-dependent methyltransferase
MPFTLEQVIPWGRSRDEYRRLFALSEQDLNSSILGVGDGPASFNAEMAAQGRRILSVDPLYAFAAAEISRRIDETYDRVVDQLWPILDSYVWREFADPDALGRHRLATMQRFLADYENGRSQGRYAVGSLPALDFADNQFDLALCSHLLFLYSEQLSYEFHLAAVKEMCRVAREVRIFPLLDLAVQPSRHLTPLQAELNGLGYQVALVPVEYEFQRGGNRMMVVSKQRSNT